MKVGITGQSGFIGWHLYHTLGCKNEQFMRIPFEDDFFEDEVKLNEFVTNCDVIVHLAALNRHDNPKVIYNTNMKLVQILISALERSQSTPHIIFASSIQEGEDNMYAKSKLKGRMLFENWAKKNECTFTGMIIPNVFGSFGRPYYNSVISTFSYQLIRGEKPHIIVDRKINLIYISELINYIIEQIILKNAGITKHVIPYTFSIKVSKILEKLKEFKKLYFDNGIIPNLKNSFEVNLFNTFRSYVPLKSYFPKKYIHHKDDRGIFVELIKLKQGGQISFSTTVPGITRGNHYHKRKIERFSVIKGRAQIQLRRIGSTEILSFDLNGKEPSYIDIPIWYIHNITNIGKKKLYTVFYISEFFHPKYHDTYFEKV